MNDTVKLAASHPDHPMLTGDELVALVSKLTHQIERCGVGPELTEAVTQASDLSFHMRRYVGYAELLRNDRDIKAANLQLLVEKVLDHAEACERCERGGNDGGDVLDAEDAWEQLKDLARSLKQ